MIIINELRKNMNEKEKNPYDGLTDNLTQTPEQNPNSLFEEQGTFCRVSSGNGILEVDLQSIKLKGVETRSISFAIPLGPDDAGEEMKAEMLFLNEADFNKFKEFISKLNWND